MDAVRSEWLKLRTVRQHWVLAILAVGFPIVVSVLTATFVDLDDYGSTDLVELVSGLAILSSFLVGVLGTLTMTSEFAHLTIRPTFAAQPRRPIVLLAKALVVALAAATLMAISVGASYFAGRQIFSSRDFDIDLSRVPEGSAPLIGAAVLGVGLAVLGLSLGMIVRNQPAAIAILVVWPLIVENLVAGLLSIPFDEGVAKWMPYAAGLRMAFVGEEDDFHSRAVSGVYFGAVVLALWLIGLALTARRDA